MGWACGSLGTCLCLRLGSDDPIASRGGGCPAHYTGAPTHGCVQATVRSRGHDKVAFVTFLKAILSLHVPCHV